MSRPSGRATGDPPQPVVQQHDEPGSLGLDTWQHLSGSLGLPALAVPEELGGAGGCWADMTTALRELGSGLVPSPLLASGLLAVGVLTMFGAQS